MLVDIEIASIYNGPLPKALARCTPDTKAAILALAAELKTMGHELRLSDLFRSRTAQLQAHQDWLTGKKRAYSPPPGSSLHEAGRAMDIDLKHLNMPLADFWKIAAKHGFTPIIDTPDTSRSEAWHFECRGSHTLVYDYIRLGKAGPGLTPYKQLATSAILEHSFPVEGTGDSEVAVLQSGLIRLGLDPGPIDGVFGARTQAELSKIDRDNVIAISTVKKRLRGKWPGEQTEAA